MSSSLRILHLEDDPQDAEIIHDVLASAGLVCDVRRVETREDFCAQLEERGLDLILADFSLPTFDGLSALEIARARRPELPFIFVSGALGEETAIDAVKNGATDYVFKDRLSRIVGSVRRAMRERQERHDAAQELQRLQARLIQAQRLEALGTLAGGIAHDFNNILAAILGYGDRVLRGLPPDGRLRRDMESILAAGERGRALVDRILTFSRSGVGERSAVHVEGVVREALDLLAAKLPADIAIHTTLQAGRAAMQGDPTQVHQVLMNLAINAIQAMPSGGTLHVSLELLRMDGERAMTIGTVEAGDYIVLEVRDSGSGIAAESLDLIFDPFFTTKETGVGTGLGLSLVHGIVTSVGGAIDVASALGRGSRFTVYLPRTSDVPEHAGDADAEQAVARGAGQRVLFVDDEELLVRLATDVLTDLGYAPVGFTSSVQAFEAFRAEPQAFDVLVTDERMPGMTGSALIQQVRSIRQDMPVLLVSGYVGDLAAARGSLAGVGEVLKKPLSARDLAINLARVFQAR